MYQLFVRYPKNASRVEDMLTLHSTHPTLARARKVAKSVRAPYEREITNVTTFIRDASRPLGEWVERKTTVFGR